MKYDLRHLLGYIGNPNISREKYIVLFLVNLLIEDEYICNTFAKSLIIQWPSALKTFEAFLMIITIFAGHFFCFENLNINI